MEQRQQANPVRWEPRWVRLADSHPLTPDRARVDVLSPADARRTRERTKALLGVAGTLLVAATTAGVLWNATGAGLRALFGTQPAHPTMAVGTGVTGAIQGTATAAPARPVGAGLAVATATPHIIPIASTTPAAAADTRTPLGVPVIETTAAALASPTAMATPAPETSPAGQAKALVTATPLLPGQRTHVVERGDTLFSIARRNGTTVGALVAANGLGSQNAPLPVGQRLRIPVVDATPAPRR